MVLRVAGSRDYTSVSNMVVIDESAIVCKGAVLTGDVTVGAGTIIHTACKINGEAGPIEIGENCLIEEKVSISNSSESGAAMKIGDNNYFEVGCTSMSQKVGSDNTIGCNAYLGPSVTLSDGCFVGATVRLETEEELPNNTIVYEDTDTSSTRRSKAASVESQKKDLQAQMEHLRKVLPRFRPVQKT